MLDALAAPAGSEDIRTKDQRYHDALHDAMRRLVASGLLPDRAGQPVKVWAHVSLTELRALDDGSVLQTEWIGEMAVRWAARRAAASQTGSDGAAWLNGKPSGAVSCDATLIPVVTGGIDLAALDDLLALCMQYAGHGPDCARHGPDCARHRPGYSPSPADPAVQPVATERPAATGQPSDPSVPRPLTPQALEMLRHAIIGKAINFLLHSRVPLDLRAFHSTDRFIPVAIVREKD